jgi:hypothetical protein
MAKLTKEKVSKVSFGVKSTGKKKKKYGPKEQKPKKYKGQGR